MRRVFKAIGRDSVRTPVYGMRIYDQEDSEYQEVPAKGWGGDHVDAVKFCQGLARLAADEGARMEVGKKVSGFLRDGDDVVGVQTSKENYRSKVVLCADGLASIHVGLAKEIIESPYDEEPYSVMNTELVGVKDIEPGWQESHPWGFDFNLGRQVLLPLDPGFCGASFQNLEHFRKVREGKSKLCKKLSGAQIAKRFPCVDRKMRGKPFPEVAFNGLLFCGEAAGNHYALHSMISADMAAQVAASAVNEGDTTRERLQAYEEWFKTSSIAGDPGRPPRVDDGQFDLAEQFRFVMEQKVSMSDIDIWPHDE